jgi:hypothetical protein
MGSEHAGAFHHTGNVRCSRSVSGLLDFVPNGSAYYGTTQCANRAASSDDRATYGADTSAYRRTLFLRRHASASGQSYQRQRNGHPAHPNRLLSHDLTPFG